jgi:hypothetical protein
LQKTTGRTNLFYLKDILGKGIGKESRNKKGGGKGNLTRVGQLFLDSTNK